MEDDPGWPWARRSVSGALPGGPVEEPGGRRPPIPGAGLMSIRVIFSAFVAGVVLFGIVTMVAVAGQKTAPANRSLMFPGVMLGCSAALLIVANMVRKPLDTSSEEALSRSYRGRFIIQAAIGVAAAQVATVGFLASAQWWMVPVVVVIWILGFVPPAPTAGALQREQERLQAAGCQYSLMAALNGSPVGR